MVAETKARKFIALTYYSSDSCPACHWPKTKMRWLCVKCSDAMKDSPEMTALSEACDAHLDAVDTVIRRAGDLAREKRTPTPTSPIPGMIARGQGFEENTD